MLTQTEQRIINFIRAFVARHDYSPTLSEIGTGVAIQSKGTVHRYVQSLIEKKQLRQPQSGWRSLELVASPPGHADTLPLLGHIAAGRPIEAVSNHDEINVAEMLLGHDRFALRVKGNSMCEAGILDGDTVIIKKTTTAKTGDIIVALIDDNEATLKRFKRLSKKQVQLIPANAELQPMTYAAERVCIQGVLTGQLRTYK